MNPNPIKQALSEGRAVIGTMIVQARAPAFIQLFAEYGLDFVFIDMEHGSYSLETAANLVQVARLSGITPLVRVCETGYQWYARLLDAGAQGIMTPRVESPQQVREIVRYTKYPPLGQRGFSRLAGHVNYTEIDFGSFVSYANENLLNIIQIESSTAVDHLEDILAAPGIDVILVGPDDLALSMGVTGNTRHQVVEQALDRIFAACEGHHIPWGLHLPDAGRLETWLRRGMKFATFSSDVWMMQQVLGQDMPRLRAAARAVEG
jgi:2-keto-3-deoxy-L-rhamnonate aldolase RhmA